MNKKCLLVLGLAGLLLFAGLPIFPKFTITDQDSASVVYIRDLSETEDFYISFIHSVNRTPVEEYYRVSDGQFIVYKTVFQSYGAGMPDPEDGFEFEVNGGYITISDINKRIKSFSVFVGTIASHEIFFKDENFLLSDIAPPRTLLKFEIKRVSLFQIIADKTKGR